MSPRRELLNKSADIIDGDRNAQYGNPVGDFVAIAEMWTTYLKRALHGQPVEKFSFRPHDVAVFIALMKISRIGWSPEKEDHWIDLAGYAACGWECVDS